VDVRDDGELARRVAAGDAQAAGELVHRYQASVRRFLRRLTGRDDLADDLAQDTFVRMLSYAGRYDPKYPMRTWLLTIARRLSINRGRRNGRVVLTDQFLGTQAVETAPDEQVIRADSQQALRIRLNDAMKELTDSQREALLLFHQQGLGVNEVAEVMGLPAGTVKSHLHRGRAAMRRILQQDGKGDPHEL
jgi:RNA polymerase sigma-70 factor, ECF subfamily